MDQELRETLQHKYEVVYFIAKENLAFSKMQPLCELEERHGVQLESGNRNYLVCSTFVEFIARNLKENQLAQLNSHCKFFSLQADVSTDPGNVEDELFPILYFILYCSDGKVLVSNTLNISKSEFSCGKAQGLFDSIKGASI